MLAVAIEPVIPAVRVSMTIPEVTPPAGVKNEAIAVGAASVPLKPALMRFMNL